MKSLRAKRQVSQIVLVGICALLCVGALLAYTSRSDRPVLYYYGASPAEVPQGTAIAILNPFRDRKDETNAEWLIRDLRTNNCERIVRDRLRTDPTPICAVLHSSVSASLIWLDPDRRGTTRGNSRTLIYDLGESQARLAIHFTTDEVGWGVSTVSLTR